MVGIEKIGPYDARQGHEGAPLFHARCSWTSLLSRDTFIYSPVFATSAADPRAVIADIWPEPWVLPFSIEPLGDLSRQIKGDLAKELWPILKDCGVGGVTAAMNATGVTVFVPIQIADSDWV